MIAIKMLFFKHLIISILLIVLENVWPRQNPWRYQRKLIKNMIALLLIYFMVVLYFLSNVAKFCNKISHYTFTANEK